MRAPEETPPGHRQQVAVSAARDLSVPPLGVGAVNVNHTYRIITLCTDSNHHAAASSMCAGHT